MTSTNMSSKQSSRSCSDSNGGGGSGTGPCGACKFLRRKCLPGCIFAPYFDSEQGTTHFAAVHKVFGASNVSKLLLHIPVHRRLDAAITICYEAQARVRDPVFGCTAHIFALQQQAVRLRAELSNLQAYLATSELPRPPPDKQAQTPSLMKPSIPSIENLLSTSTTMSDLSLLLNPEVQTSQSIQQPMSDPCRIGSNNFLSMGSGDQQLVNKQLGSTQFTGASPFPYPFKRA